jgi:hypothetical protein
MTDSKVPTRWSCISWHLYRLSLTPSAYSADVFKGQRRIWLILKKFIPHIQGTTTGQCIQKNKYIPNLHIPFHPTLPCIVIYFFLNNQPDPLIIQIYSVIKLYMFRAPSLPIIRSALLYIRHWYVSFRF